MNILNVSSIIPLKGLKRENDIIVVVQDYLKKKYKYKFTIAKSLPYVNRWLAKCSKKWGKYYEYQQKGVSDVQDYQTLVYPWLTPSTSNFWLIYFLIPFNWIWFKVCLQHKFSCFAKKSDMFLAQNAIPDAVVAYWLYKEYSIPYICTIIGNFNPYITSLPFLKSVFKNAADIITPSPTNYNNLKHSLDIKFIPHPVDSLFYNDNRKDFSSIKLVSICRLLSLKHIDWIINILASLNGKGYQFEYHIAGDGPELENLKLLTTKLNLTNRINFHGYLNKSDVNKLLKASHIFIMPSYPETLGRAFLEAAASNCLCIGHKNTGVDGLFKHQESAIFVNENTIANEIEAIFQNFSGDFFEPYIKNARHIVNQLTWEKIGEKYHEVYSNALKVTSNV